MLHLSVSRSDAHRRLLTLALEDAEYAAYALKIFRANEPRGDGSTESSFG